MQFKKSTMDLGAAKDLENATAMVAKQAATIEYLAMMCDVELPTENDEATQNE